MYMYVLAYTCTCTLVQCVAPARHTCTHVHAYMYSCIINPTFWMRLAHSPSIMTVPLYWSICKDTFLPLHVHVQHRQRQEDLSGLCCSTHTCTCTLSPLLSLTCSSWAVQALSSYALYENHPWLGSCQSYPWPLSDIGLDPPLPASGISVSPLHWSPGGGDT